jgi:beta-lactamase regulating signal transducer with metallopeptidase domain
MDGLVEVLNEASCVWADAMWAALWQSSLLAGGVLGVTALCKGLSPVVRYWLWMFVGLRLLVMPFLTVELPTPYLQPEVERVAIAGSSFQLSGNTTTSTPVVAGAWHGPNLSSAGPAGIESPLPVVSSPAEENARSASLRPAGLIMLCWAAGFSIALVRLGLACTLTRRIIARADFGEVRTRRLAARMAHLFDLRCVPRVGVSEESIAPFVYGVWNPEVIVPRCLLEKASDEQLLVVLAHEFAHVKRKDSLLGWLFALCHALYFFHPVLPFVKRQLLLERERACDDLVLAVSQSRPSTYARVLVSVAALCSPGCGAAGPALIAGETFQDLKTRLRGLGSGARPHTKLSPWADSLLILAGMASAPGVVFSTAPPEAPEIVVAVEVPISPVADQVEVFPQPTAFAAAVRETSEGSVEPTFRVLRFPANRTVGELKVRDRSLPHHIDSFYYWTDEEDWRNLGAARGKVHVPDDKEVWLIVNEEGSRDITFLGQLAPHALYRLSGVYAEPGRSGFDDADLAEATRLAGLRELDLLYTNVTDAGLALATDFPNLERLWLPRQTTDIGLAQVAKLSELHALYIKMNYASDAGLAHLEKLTTLRELELGGGAFSNAGLVHVAELPNLEYLFLWGKQFSDAGMTHLASAPALRILNVSHQDLSNRGVQQIAKIRSLENLSLYNIPGITGVALRHLTELPSLRMLDLSTKSEVKTRIDNQSLGYLAQCTSLEHLVLPGSTEDSGLEQIAAIPHLTTLQLTGGGTPVLSDRGMIAIGRISTLKNFMAATGKEVTDEGLTAIGNLHNLEKFWLLSNSENLSDSGIASLAELRNLEEFYLTVPKRSAVTLGGMRALEALSSLRKLELSGCMRGEGEIDLSPFAQLEVLGLGAVDGIRDGDLAGLAGMTRLRNLAIAGGSDESVAPIANLTSLERLSIQSDELTDAGLRHLRNLSAVDVISLRGNFTDVGLAHLSAMQNIKWLTIQSTIALSDGSLARLWQTLPNLQLLNGQGGFGGG